MLTFNSEDHTYYWNSQEVIGVTQVFSSIGIKKNEYWQSISGSEFINNEYASVFGNEFHRLPVYRLKSVYFKVNKEAQPYVNGLDKFLNNYKDSVPKLIEHKLYSKKYGYAGTLDLLFNQKNSKFLLVDWKTSTGFFKYWRMQLAAYSQLIRELYNLKSWPETVSVRIIPNGYKTDYRKPNEVAIDFNRFLSVLNTYKLLTKDN